MPKLKLLLEHVEELMDKGIIGLSNSNYASPSLLRDKGRPSNSNYASPLLLRDKGNGKCKVVTD
jgi:hypothetical protein